MIDLGRVDKVGNCGVVISLLTAVLMLSLAKLSTCSFAYQEQDARKLLFDEPYEYLETLGLVSSEPDYLSRTYMTPAHRDAAALLKKWFEEAGLEAHIDILGNVHGRLVSANKSAPFVLLGSHYDTVIDGGKYDGALGIIASLSAVKMMLLEAEARKRLEKNATSYRDTRLPQKGASLAPNLVKSIHIVGFCDEEGIRFQSTFLGSRALTGDVIEHKMLEARDKEGLTLKQLLLNEGIRNVETNVQALALNAASIDQYVEVHIEQGPVLERLSQPLGVVRGIAGQTRLWVCIEGVQGHAGTVPMAGRQDPLAAAAVVVTSIEQTCGGVGSGSVNASRTQDMLVCTVGQMLVYPNAVNTIPRFANFSIDIRSLSDSIREEVVGQVKKSILDTCDSRQVSCLIETRHTADAVPCDANIIENFMEAVRLSRQLLHNILRQKDVNNSHNANAAASNQTCREDCQMLRECRNEEVTSNAESEVPLLVSGAGHDAMAIAKITRVGMLFVKCKGGISHSPDESASQADIAAATAALATYLLREAMM